MSKKNHNALIISSSVVSDKLRSQTIYLKSNVAKKVLGKLGSFGLSSAGPLVRSVRSQGLKLLNKGVSSLKICVNYHKNLQ